MGLHLENEVARRVASDHHRSHARSIPAVGQTRQRIFKPAFTAAMDRAWDRWWSDATRLATSFSRCNPTWFLSMGLRQESGLPVRYVTKTWSVVLLNKKYIYSYLKCIVYDKWLKPRQSFWITLYFEQWRPVTRHVLVQLLLLDIFTKLS